MAKSHEYKLAETLVWSNQDFSLAEFVEDYELPQVISVEVGYCGATERTTFSSGQILTLHCLHTTSKAVCDVPHSDAVVIPMTCELKAEVIPMDCHESIITAHQISTLYQNIKYIRVHEIGSVRNNNTMYNIKPNDILHIKKIERKNSLVRCKNMANSETVLISIDSTAVFVPLVSHQTHTLAEIKKNFGFPAKVQFLDKKAEIQLRSLPGNRMRKHGTLLSDLGQLTIMEEQKNTDVIVTTVCSNLDETICLNVPTTLDIRVTVAEGFLHGDENYQKIVRTLDKQLKRTNLKAFEDLDVNRHEDAVQRSMKEIDNFSFDKVSSEEKESAKARLQKRVSMKKSMPRMFKFGERPPPIPKRQQSTEKPAPAIPPKPGTKPAETHSDKKNITKRLKAVKIPMKSPDWLKRIQNRQKSPLTEDNEDANYVEAIKEEEEGYYASVDDIFAYRYDQTSSSESDSENYTSIDESYIPTPREYQKLNKNLQPRFNMPPPPIPTAGPSMVSENTLTPDISAPTIPKTGLPKSEEERQAIYEAVAKFPQDLSGLSVTDVSRLLRYLGMASYVETFETELIDGIMLSSMDAESLESLNMKTFHVKKLVNFINGWRPNV